MEVQTTAARLGIEERLNEFIAALRGEDELGVVIRAHIYIEHELIAFIKAKRPAAEVLAADRGYGRKVECAFKLELPADFKPALHFTGVLRNRFAHELEAAISEQDADKFEGAIEKDAIAAVHSAVRKIGTVESQRQLDPRERVTLCFVALWSGIAVAAIQAKEAAA